LKELQGSKRCDRVDIQTTRKMGYIFVFPIDPTEWIYLRFYRWVPTRIFHGCVQQQLAFTSTRPAATECQQAFIFSFLSTSFRPHYFTFYLPCVPPASLYVYGRLPPRRVLQWPGQQWLSIAVLTAGWVMGCAINLATFRLSSSLFSSSSSTASENSACCWALFPARIRAGDYYHLFCDAFSAFVDLFFFSFGQ
jgi:hypothetical protein